MKSIKARWITPIIIAIDLSERRIRVTLRTLNVRNTRTVLKACKFPAPPPLPQACITISMIEIVTTAPSKRFIRSAAYFFTPRASNFMLISAMKIHVKIVLRNSISEATFGSMSYDSIDIPIVLTRTQKVMRLSKKEVRVKALSKERAFLIELYAPLGQTRVALIQLSTQALFFMFRVCSSTSCPDHTGSRFLNQASTMRTSIKSISRPSMSLGRLKATLSSLGMLSTFYLGSMFLSPCSKSSFAIFVKSDTAAVARISSRYCLIEVSISCKALGTNRSSLISSSS